MFLVLLVISLGIYHFRNFAKLKQTYLIKEQQHQIEYLYNKVKNLYQGMFELEELCEDLILELEDKNKEQAALAQKNRIIHAHQVS